MPLGQGELSPSEVILAMEHQVRAGCFIDTSLLDVSVQFPVILKCRADKYPSSSGSHLPLQWTKGRFGTQNGPQSNIHSHWASFPSNFRTTVSHLVPSVWHLSLFQHMQVGFLVTTGTATWDTFHRFWNTNSVFWNYFGVDLAALL